LDSFHTQYQRRILHIRWHDSVSMLKFYIEPVSLQPHLSYANEGLDFSVMLPDFRMISQQTRYSRPAVKLKMVSGHHPTGSVLEVKLPLPGYIRSAGTWNTSDWRSEAGG